MTIHLTQILAQSPEMVLFLVLGLGFLIGKKQIRGYSLGVTPGVLITGLVFGHFGFAGPDATKTLGFILFIYSVGYQAGPRFFGALLADGTKYVALAAVTATTAFVAALGLTQALGLPHGYGAGVLAGSLASTPTLAAAQSAATAGVAARFGLTTQELLQNVTAGYAITYLFGTVGVMMAVNLLPRCLGLDLAGEARALAHRLHFRDENERDADEPAGGEAEDEEEEGREPEVLRAYQVTSEAVTGKPLAEINLPQRHGCWLVEIRRGQEKIQPGSGTILEPGDRVAVTVALSRLAAMPEVLGPEITDRCLLAHQVKVSSVVLTAERAAGRTLGDLRVLSAYNVRVSRIVRSQIELPVRDDLPLLVGDTLEVHGVSTAVDRFARDFGVVEQDVKETDILTFAFGIAAGLLLARITVDVGDLQVGLGMAGGLLVAGIAVGYFRANRPTFGRVPPAARWVLMQLGLLLFMAGVGLEGGRTIVSALQTVGATVFLSGVAVTLIPVAVGYGVGRYALGLNPVILVGAITGAMTNTPALQICSAAARSSLPALGYAGTYAFANVLLPLAGAALMAP